MTNMRPMRDRRKDIEALVARPPTHDNPGLEEVIIEGYRDYQGYVEGLIEAVGLVLPADPLDLTRAAIDTPFTMWVNEEYTYKFTQREWNFVAAVMSAHGGRPDLMMQGVLGPVLFTGPSDGEGETMPLSPVVRKLVEMVQTATDEDIQ